MIESCQFGRPETSIDACFVGLRGEVHSLQQRFGKLHDANRLLGVPPCSLELISPAYQLWYRVFLSQ
jgi:hypothetical protein